MQKRKLKKEVKVGTCRPLRIKRREGRDSPLLTTSAFLLGHVTGLHSPASLAAGGPPFEFHPVDVDRSDVLLLSVRLPHAFFCTLSSFYLTEKDTTIVTLEALY